MSLPPSAVVLGLARSGRAAAAALERRGTQVNRADRELGNDTDVTLLDGAGLLVKSPGVPGEAVLVAEARRRRIPVWSELELGYRLLDNPLAAVTGTNGKTTTSELLGAMLSAPVAGNVGRALCELDGEIDPGEWIVVEASSFQLEDVDEFRPRVAVLLNLEPDHLDRHGSFDAYAAAKLRVFENQGLGDVAVVPRGFGAVPDSGDVPTSTGRTRSGGAADSRRAQPRRMRRRRPSRRVQRAPPTTRSRARFASFPAYRTGSSRCASATASSS
jgi:UDP-N-acetylmuramoylalanine--D-glutamate ligase